jgi:hypothetical protein
MGRNKMADKKYWANEAKFAVEGLQEAVNDIENKIERSEREISEFIKFIDEIKSKLGILKVGLNELLEQFKDIEGVKFDAQELRNIVEREINAKPS